MEQGECPAGWPGRACAATDFGARCVPALEDAWHLARCLDGASGGLDDVFQAFSRIRAPKTARLAEQGRVFARGLFATDPETCRIRNERAKASDPVSDVQVLAAGWGQGLPMPACTDGMAAQGGSFGSLYRIE